MKETVGSTPAFSSGGYFFTERLSISCIHPLIIVMPEGSKGSVNEHERTQADLIRKETKRRLTGCMLEILRIPSFSSSVYNFDLLKYTLDMK